MYSDAASHKALRVSVSTPLNPRLMQVLYRNTSHFSLAFSISNVELARIAGPHVCGKHIHISLLRTVLEQLYAFCSYSLQLFVLI
jgi:hypothetical protein